MSPQGGRSPVAPTFFIIIIIFQLLTCGCRGKPIIGGDATDVAQVVEFLSKYGYLESSEAHSLRSERSLREAVRAMQEFGHLPLTGRIDAETVRLVRRRRCGLPDLLPGQPSRLRRYAIQGQRWPSTNLTWSVKGGDEASGLVRPQLRRAFAVWSAASALSFRELPAGQGGDVQVSFLKGQHGDGYPFDGEGAVLAHAFFPGEGIGGDAHFDAEERWLPSQPDHEDDGVNLFAVAAHEIGHSLGLSHSSTPGSLMFPYYQVMGEHFTLPQDDADGIRHLYGFKDSFVQPTMPSLPPTEPTTTASSTSSSSSTTPQPPTSTTKKSKLSTKKPIPTFKPTSSVTTARSPVTTIPPDVPDVCNISIDAISVIRRELFVFKGKHFWRLDGNLTVKPGYPASIERFWYALPSDVEKVDAVYERPHDTKIMFFIGKQFWLFSGNQLEQGYPRPLTDLGLPEDVERVDAALVWGHNGRTYLFGGRRYWKLDEAEGRVELDYPRSIAAWRGVPEGLDAAFQWTNGNTYFFKGNQFWKFIDIKMKIEIKAALKIGDFWFKCQNQTENPKITTPVPPVMEKEVLNLAAQLQQPFVHLIFLLAFWTCYGTFITNI